MNNTLKQILGLKPEPLAVEDYNFCVSSHRPDGNSVISIGPIFAMLLPKVRISSKYRGYDLEVPPLTDLELDDYHHNNFEYNTAKINTEWDAADPVDESGIERVFSIGRYRRGSSRLWEDICDAAQFSLLYSDQYHQQFKRQRIATQASIKFQKVGIIKTEQDSTGFRPPPIVK